MHIVILGNGISGVTAARFLRKLTDHRVTIVSAETDYFFSRTALMYVYMGHMNFKDTRPYENWFWSKNRIELVRGWVNRIDFEHKRLYFDNRLSFDTEHGDCPESLDYDRLVLAVGSKSREEIWHGSDLQGVRGLYSYQDLAYLEKESERINHAIIVGGGLIGVELAEMLRTRSKGVTMLIRESSYWRNILPAMESEMISRHIREHGVDLNFETELNSIHGDEGRCASVETNTGQVIECDYVGLTIGVTPNVGWLRDTDLEINRGILVDESLQTSIPGVYAVGDCAEQRNPQAGRKPVEAVWYTGRIMGETVAYVIAGYEVNYNPGIWFNSAKFFDIEYQIYGRIDAETPSDIDSLYWEHENENKALRINYDAKSGAVVGFNALGVRLRQDVCTAWIEGGAHIDRVLRNFHEAEFNPEFFSRVSRELVRVHGDTLSNSMNNV